MTPPGGINATAGLETPFFFRNGSYELFGVLHEPGEAACSKGFVFCHPFGEEKLWAQRVYVTYARELARLGYAVLRFDCMGHGDSDGQFEESSIETQLSDIRRSCDVLMSRVPHLEQLGLLGLRLGASLAALAAERVAECRRLILWEPILDGRRYMDEVLRINLATQNAVYRKIVNTRKDLVEMMKAGNTVNVDGYELSFPLFAQASAIGLGEPAKTFSGDCLIVQIAKGDQPVRNDLAALARSYPRADVLRVAEEPFWREIKQLYSRADNLFRETSAWLERA